MHARAPFRRQPPALHIAEPLVGRARRKRARGSDCGRQPDCLTSSAPNRLDTCICGGMAGVGPPNQTSSRAAQDGGLGQRNATAWMTHAAPMASPRPLAWLSCPRLDMGLSSVEPSRLKVSAWLLRRRKCRLASSFCAVWSVDGGGRVGYGAGMREAARFAAPPSGTNRVCWKPASDRGQRIHTLGPPSCRSSAPAAPGSSRSRAPHAWRRPAMRGRPSWR